MHVAIQIQGFWRKEKKLKSSLKGSLAILKRLRLQRGGRKTSAKWHPRSNPVTNTYRNIKPQVIITQYA